MTTNKKNSSNDVHLLPTPSEIVRMISQHVIGHDKAKRDLATAAYQHFMSCARAEVEGKPVIAENNTLISGPSGCGKSLIVKALGRVLGMPVFYLPCTNISPNGYKGTDVNQWLSLLSKKIVDEDDVRTNPAIVVLDEVDKLRNDGSHQGSYRLTVQQELLTYLDGTLCGNDCEMDSSYIFNIAAGAFVGLDEIRQVASNRPTIGFRSPDLDPNHIEQAKNLLPLCPEHLIRFGFTPEFVGRFSNLTALEQLDSEAMRRILLEAQNNVLARKKEFFALHGVRIVLADCAIDAIVTLAMQNPTGARSLRLIIDKLFASSAESVGEM